jgi:hypothetical protein
MPDNCRNWHQVAADENCDSILTVYTYITKDQFFEWNPVLNGDCNSLWQNNWYCVAAFDSDYPLPPTVTATPSPIPDNSPRDCAHWYFLPTEDTCQSIAEIFGTFDAQDFVSWNPSVYDDCSNIKADTWYCVGRPDTPTTRTEGAPTQTEPGESMPTQSGITEPCSEYWLVSNTDTCESIASDSGVTEDALLEWNPALGPECEGLLPDHYICVGISSSTTNAPPTQTGSTATTSPRPTSTSDGAPISTPSPVREGMVSGCRRFYLQHPGEACWDMAQKAGISVE